jgi:mono/diheme cytochrome c family protein
LPDDSASVDAITHKAIGGNIKNGKKRYDGNCAQCHGLDGKLIVFRSEGVNESIGSVANRDPYRFLHRTRFGVAGIKEMPVGRELGWEPAVSVDILAYAQSLPIGTEKEDITNAGAGSQTSPKLGGPQGGVLGGILSGLGAVFSMLGISIFFLLGLLILGAVIVWALRKRN